ncbi:hypothetical protein EK21DRAFT_85151 [Setomelanomma holmii]|uniref:Uncharacterized protein n=1 Tax=Setomelanomma holmii TaxID=210430 RepID=A0A9P4HJ74_9PLEO|nr:hypothetical protein EK21DRAFT_85151 [Setomelanomma holmii]
MAGGKGKKRLPSPSPTQPSNAERACQSSRTASVQSESATVSRDSYARSSARNATSIPTNDDWVFRVKVISSTNDLNNEVFKKAVQGLVKICFPSGVLEELGIDVLKQHMEEEHAPAENIAKMTEILHEEMIQRVAWMLAGYLDTSDKVEVGVRSVIEASAELHSKLGDDLREAVAASLERQQSDPEHDLEDDMEHLTEKEPSPPPKKKRRQSKADNARARPHDDVGSAMDIDPPAQAHESSQAAWLREVNNDNKKISASWRWDINPDDFSLESAPEVFKRASDLFAFHALPIARHMLDANATSKELRLQIQSMLADMPDSEFHKWAHSLQKLYEGDDNMLVRVEPEAVSGGRTRSMATPAPIDMRKRTSASKSKAQRNANQSGSIIEAVRTANHRHPLVKIEASANAGMTDAAQYISTAYAHEAVEATTTAFRHLSTEERDLGSSVVGLKGAEGIQATRNLNLIREGSLPQTDRIQCLTPIVNLLFGAMPLDGQGRKKTVAVIMNNLKQRVRNDVGTTPFQ